MALAFGCQAPARFLRSAGLAGEGGALPTIRFSGQAPVSRLWWAASTLTQAHGVRLRLPVADGVTRPRGTAPSDVEAVARTSTTAPPLRRRHRRCPPPGIRG